MKQISNWFSLSLFLTFYPFAAVVGVPISIVLANTTVSLFLLVVFVFLFYRGYLGGGAAKLVCALSVWLGPTFDLVIFLVVTATILSVSYLFIRIIRKHQSVSHIQLLIFPSAAGAFAFAFIGSEPYNYAEKFVIDSNLFSL